MAEFAAWRQALTGELCWTAAPDRPRVLAAVPLLDGEMPCVAIPYAWAETVGSVGTDGSKVAFAVSDAGSRRRGGGTGMAVLGQAEVIEDVDGGYFDARLLRQELLKYPPSRALADSPLLRRENWWWLPRLIVRLARVDRVLELPVRTDRARDALLVRADGIDLRLDVVRAERVEHWAKEKVRLERVDQAGHVAGGLRGDGAPALAFGHDHSESDLERWESWHVRGTLLGDDLVVSDRDGEPGASLDPLGLLDRMRRHRALRTACRRGIDRAKRR